MQPNGQGGRICFIVNGIPSDKKFLNTTGLTQQLMKTLQKQISLFGEEELTSSRVDFLVNRTAQPESGSERKTSDTCGPKCAESFERFNHVGLWAKTFSALLIGTGDWYSKRCKLTWKLKGTKYNRLYFQLQASAIAPTKGTGFGLLLTPTTREEVVDLDKFKKRMEKYPNGTTMPNLATQVIGLLKTPCAADAYTENLSKKEQKFGNSGTLAQEIQSGFVEQRWPGLLPTPTMYDYNSARHPELWEKDKKKYAEKGINLQCGLKQMNVLGLLPTPQARDEKNGSKITDKRIQRKIDQGWTIDLNDMATSGMLPTPQAADGGKLGGNENQDSLTKRARLETGKTSQLSPHFVLELMGFPPNFTELPFLNGETNQSRPPETQSVPK